MRAIAVLLVLLFHFDLIPGNRAGFIGVDVFFVISGYLITSILTRQLNDGSFSLASFYVARVRRLAPALFATLLLTLAAGAALLFPGDIEELARQVLASQLYVANFYFWKNVNYFGLGSDSVFLLHMWSLAVEEQFYLIYPLAIWAIHRYRPRWLAAALALGLMASFALNVAFVGRKPEAAFYLLPTRAWELLAGALVVLAASRPRSRATDEAAGYVGVGLLVIAVGCYRTDFSFPGYFALLPVVSAGGLLLSGASRSTWISRALARPEVTYIGKISYPLYLVHWPINVFAQRWLNEQYDLKWRLAMFAMSLLLAAFLYHFVESPVRRRRLMMLDKVLLRGYAAALAATLLMFALVEQTNGLPRRFPPEVIRLAGFVDDKSPPLAECEFAGKPLQRDADFCAIGAPGHKATWLVYGDSHAWAAHAAFDKWLALKGVAGLFMYRNSCPPIVGVHILRDKGNCFAFNRSILAFLDGQPGIGVVCLVSTWRQAPEARLTNSPNVTLSKAESLALFDEKFSQTVTHLHGIGKKVYVWEPVPGAAKSVPLAMARAELDHEPAKLELSRSQYTSDNAFFFSAVEKNKAKISVLLSPADALCKDGVCAVTINGNPAYFDNAHITRSSADFWVRMMQNAESHEAGVER